MPGLDDACDVAESCDGIDNDCPADTGLPDGDADTVCDMLDNCPDDANTGQENNDADPLGDACDPCTGGASATKQKLTLTKLIAPAGDDKFSLGGEAVVPALVSGIIDPVTDGVRLLVLDSLGTPVFDATIPAGAYDIPTRTGWKANSSLTSFTYKKQRRHASRRHHPRERQAPRDHAGEGEVQGEGEERHLLGRDRESPADRHPRPRSTGGGDRRVRRGHVAGDSGRAAELCPRQQRSERQVQVIQSPLHRGRAASWARRAHGRNVRGDGAFHNSNHLRAALTSLTRAAARHEACDSCERAATCMAAEQPPSKLVISRNKQGHTDCFSREIP
jgi:hypothetical protein